MTSTPDGIVVVNDDEGDKPGVAAAASSSSDRNAGKPGFPWLLTLGAAILTGLTAHARLGYQFGFADQMVLAIKGVSNADSTAFVGDWFNANATQPHWSFDLFTTVGETLGALPAAYFLYFLASLVIFGAATAILAQQWLAPRAQWLSLLVGPVLVLGPISPLGSTTPVLPWAIPHVLGGCLVYLSIACLITHRPVAAAAVGLFAAVAHVQHGANLAVVLLLYSAVATDLSKRDRLLVAASGAAAALHATVATRLLGITGNGDDFLEICLLRSPHHCDANSWTPNRVMDGFYLSAMVALLIWARRRNDLRILVVSAAVPLVGLLFGVWADRLDVPFFGELAQTTNIYRLVTLILPLAAWSPIVALENSDRESVRFPVVLLSIVLLTTWFGSYSAVADSSVNGGMAMLLAFATVGIVGLALWSPTLPACIPKALAAAFAVLLVGAWAPLAMRDFHVGLDPTDPRVQVGRRIEAATPPGSVIAASPSLTWLRFAGRRAVITDCKAVPYGGLPWLEFKERIAALGGWDCRQLKGFATLTLDDVEDLGEKFGATHLLVAESDPKYLAAAEAGWRLVDEFPSFGAAVETRSDNEPPLIRTRLYEIG